MSKLTQPIRLQPVRQLAADRRTSVRQTCNLKARWRPYTNDPAESWAAAVHDISAEGVGLTLREQCVHRLLVVVLCDVQGNPAYTKMLRVKHAAEAEPGQWRLGATFAKALAEDELDWLLNADAWMRPVGP